MENRYEKIIHPLEPCFNENSKILILGSFPSVKTREYGFFYGHKQNRFYKIMEVLFEMEIGDSIEDRRKFLLENRIGLYDSIYECEIIGSSDSSIRNVIPTDLSQIINNSMIKQVFTNGNTSHEVYRKYHEKNLNIKDIKLPSSSSANARYSLDDLVDKWKIILEYL